MNNTSLEIPKFVVVTEGKCSDYILQYHHTIVQVLQCMILTRTVGFVIKTTVTNTVMKSMTNKI